MNRSTSIEDAVTGGREGDGAPRERLDFIRAIIAEDLKAGKHGGRVVTRFPPEPNGYLHIGHAKSIVLNFGIADEVPGAVCHLRFDDTNPETEDEHYVHSIMESVQWLGYDWGEHLYFASDYFPQMYGCAEYLIGEGRAYVDSSTDEEIREARGTITESGRPTRYRDRAPEESLDLFRRMRAGEFPNGAHVLRAKMDLASPNMLLRDPVLYRIRHAEHYRTGDEWCIYPLYDFAHSIEDAIECVTHSLCTLEFENNRPLYDWVVEGWQGFVGTGAMGVVQREARPIRPCRPHQYEFARGELDYTVMSKRMLLELVKGGYVSGWDDPRMPTLAGLRRRGVTPEAIRAFWEPMGVAKTESRIDVAALEFAIRDDLNQRAPRVLCVLRPLKVVITNYPEGRTEELDASYWPHDVPKEGSRALPFGREIYIDRDDFMEDPPKGYFRLAPGREVRLRYAYLITCTDVVRDGDGEIVELRCTYDPETRGGSAPDGRTVKGTLHWVSAEHALPCEVRLYDRLFSVPEPDAGEEDFKTYLNPESLVVVAEAMIEPSVKDDPPGARYQFERQGYFVSDMMDSSPDSLVFNRTVTLRDTWAKRNPPPSAPGAGGQGSRGAGERGGAQRRGEGENGKASEQRPFRIPQSAIRNPAPPRSPGLEARRTRYVEELGLSGEEAEILTREEATADLFDAALGAEASVKGIANWTIHELPREIGGRTVENLPFSGADLGALVALVENDTLSSSAGREVLAEMVRTGGAPANIVDRLGLRQVSDPDALAPMVDEVVAANPGKADEYREGRTGLLGFFVGQVMRRTGGKANPEVVKDLLARRLDRLDG